MSPLYAAVSHGCAAGRHQEVVDEIYQRRIQRNNESFNTRTLGAVGAELAALVDFFGVPWEKLIRGLSENDEGYVLNEVGFDLHILGRLQEATQPLQTALQVRIESESWGNAAIVANNLSQLYLAIGNLSEALAYAQKSSELAEHGNDEFWRMASQATLAHVLHQGGRSREAAAAFCKAEGMQKQLQPTAPFLYSLRGFQYCDLLLSQGRTQEVKERAIRALEISERKHFLLYTALDNLSLACACLIEAQNAAAKDTTQAGEFLQRAVGGLRKAGVMEYISRGLLARAELYRFTGDYERAERDLDEVRRIATRSGMGLYLADYHLESARLRLAQGNTDKAREHLATAREMVERMGYHRRDGEVQELAAQLD